MKLSINYKICSTSSKVVSRCLVLLITAMHYYSTSIMSWSIVYSLLGVVVLSTTIIVKYSSVATNYYQSSLVI
jgi:hypothetical protein